MLRFFLLLFPIFGKFFSLGLLRVARTLAGLLQRKVKSIEIFALRTCLPAAPVLTRTAADGPTGVDGVL